MANIITIARLVLLFAVIALIYVGNVQVITLCIVLLAIVFASDGLDGWVARRRGSTSQFGAMFDIAGDRVVENALWIVFADLSLIGVWVPLLVMTRGFLVDGLRAISYSEGMTAFGDKNMMRSDFTRWLTAGRFMRGLYGYAKALGFMFLTGLVAYREQDTTDTFLGAVYDVDAFRFIGWVLVWASVALTVIRGLPVIVDALAIMSEEQRAKSPEPLAGETVRPTSR
jgi:CDP-diacylglycerol---glycerol-3-phosphate 3-phosphatidyltransferase